MRPCFSASRTMALRQAQLSCVKPAGTHILITPAYSSPGRTQPVQGVLYTPVQEILSAEISSTISRISRNLLSLTGQQRKKMCRPLIRSACCVKYSRDKTSLPGRAQEEGISTRPRHHENSSKLLVLADTSAAYQPVPAQCTRVDAGSPFAF